MTVAVADPGSFRDPSGTVFQVNGRIFRSVAAEASRTFHAARDCGLIDVLVERGMLLPAIEADRGFDRDVLDRTFTRAETKGLSFQALWLDAANPSPDQGWAQHERRGLGARAGADALLALALVHHIAIGRNVPLARAVDWLVGLAPAGIVEFVPRADPMVQRLLAHRANIFQDFTEENFLGAVSARADRAIRSDVGRAAPGLV